ncbi:MAG TPA: hypothetical protein VFO01_03890 [Trebonia sp.]|nr:hypothetical protein [Trebonia sp.]
MATGKASWEQARTLIEKEAGPVTSVTEISGGLNSEISVIVRTDHDATFVKGRRADHPRAWTQERERLINPLVRHISAPLKWSAAGDDWNLLGFECVPGAHADYSPGSRDLPKVTDTLRQLQDIALPGGTEVKQAGQRWAAYTPAPELLAGTSLLHTEWTPGNVLVSDRARLVDWAWPTRGAAWIDPACLTVWLIASGHTPRSAESWAARIPSWHTAPAGALAEFARIQALMWEGIAADSGGQWTANLARAARQWASHRQTRLPPPGNANERNQRAQVHPAQRLSAPDGTVADIDTEIVPLVRALWALGLATTASCQDFGEGTAGQRETGLYPSRYGGDAFIAYYTGWA